MIQVKKWVVLNSLNCTKTQQEVSKFPCNHFHVESVVKINSFNKITVQPPSKDISTTYLNLNMHALTDLWPGQSGFGVGVPAGLAFCPACLFSIVCHQYKNLDKCCNYDSVTSCNLQHLSLSLSITLEFNRV